MRRARADVTGREFAGPEISPADRSALRMDAASHHTLAAAVIGTVTQGNPGFIHVNSGDLPR